MRTLLVTACFAALSAALIPLAAFAQDDTPNPLKRSKIGSFARYSFEISSPARTDFGTYEVKLLRRQGTTYTVKEKVVQGAAGYTENEMQYPLAPMMISQVKATYAKVGFTEFKITKSTLSQGVSHDIDDVTFNCRRLHIEFEAVQQKRRCKGDLFYDLSSDDRVGPLGIVVFRSLVSYEIAPDKFSLTQQLTLRLQLK